MIDLAKTIPAPEREERESPFGGGRITYEWSTLKGGLIVQIDTGRAPTWSDGRTAGTGLDGDFLAALKRLGIERVP